ncbi:homeodomain-interacting protein kinase 1-like [Trachinotus anak]|uniref:homeodomain-interacting protein kinase 1-like n=1 Tax=Trachinotus anak TaxID=443729 RepID=UPI0039F18E7C
MAHRPLISTVSQNYKMLKVLGQGCYGQVIKCLKRDTEETVAVKVLKQRHSQFKKIREIVILEKLRCLDPDKSNIVRCHEWFHRIDQTFLVFEFLDMSLFDYMCQRKWAPLPLNGMRTIVKDVATALSALNSVGLIHADLKLDNIMLVDHQRQPYRVRLIDFGLTLHTFEARPGLSVQPLWQRSPEILFGLQFTEAIDIWSFGTMMAEMLVGFPLFPGGHEYDVLRFIIDILGEPPKRLLNNGIKTQKFYRRSLKYRLFNHWKFKMPVDFFTETGIKPVETRRHRLSSLDDLKTMSLHQENSTEAAGRSASVELLKEMLQMDPRKRITPSKVLAHPFITGSHLSPSNSSHFQAEQKKKTNSLKSKDKDLKLESITDRIKTKPAVDCDIVSTPVVHPNSSLNQAASSRHSFHTPDISEPKKKKKKKIKGLFSTLKRKFSSSYVSEGNDKQSMS